MMTRDPVIVGMRLREARETRLLSAPQLALCEALGITPNDLMKEEKA